MGILPYFPVKTPVTVFKFIDKERVMEKKKFHLNDILYITLAILLLAGIGFRSFTSPAPEQSGDISAASAASVKTAAAGHTARIGSTGRSLWSESAHTALKDSDVSARMYAVLELRKHLTLESVELLARFLNDSDSVVQSEAIDALGYIALNSGLSDEVFKILLEKASDRNYSSHGQALITAAMLGRDQQILPVINDYISESDLERMSYAVKAMSFIASPGCIPSLIRVLDLNDDPEIQKNVFMILAKIDTPEARNLLREYVLSLDANEQMNSAWALARLNKDAYNSILIDAIEQDELDEYAIGTIAASPVAPEVFEELFRKEGIDPARKEKLLRILARYAQYAPGEAREALGPMIEYNTPSSGPDTDPDGPSGPPLDSGGSDKDETVIRDNYQRLPPEVIFDSAKPVQEKQLAWQAWKTRAHPSPPNVNNEGVVTNKKEALDYQDLIAATQHPDPQIRADAINYKNYLGY